MFSFYPRDSLLWQILVDTTWRCFYTSSSFSEVQKIFPFLSFWKTKSRMWPRSSGIIMIWTNLNTLSFLFKHKTWIYSVDINDAPKFCTRLLIIVKEQKCNIVVVYASYYMFLNWLKCIGMCPSTYTVISPKFSFPQNKTIKNKCACGIAHFNLRMKYSTSEKLPP